MKVYLDYIFVINFLFDFILLLGVSLLLKRKVSKTRLLLGSLFGGISFFIVFLKVSAIVFFIIKMILALLMLVITFSYKNYKYTMNNFFFLIILSILLGGFLYLVNVETGYSHIGMLFFKSGKTLNVFILFGLSILLIFIYYIYMKRFKQNNSTIHKCKLKYKNRTLSLTGYLDTGNQLTYMNKPVVIINKNTINAKTNLLIPFTTINGESIMKGFYSDLEIEELGYFKKVVVALSNDKFHIEGADIILNNMLKEDKNDNKIFKKDFKKKK